MRSNRHVDIKIDLSPPTCFVTWFVTRRHPSYRSSHSPLISRDKVYNALINFIQIRVRIHMKEPQSKKESVIEEDRDVRLMMTTTTDARENSGMRRKAMYNHSEPII
jgi:hypothetical protein